jgi:hypothetical protein
MGIMDIKFSEPDPSYLKGFTAGAEAMRRECEEAMNSLIPSGVEKPTEYERGLLDALAAIRAAKVEE